MCGASITSMPPRSCVPLNATLAQSFPGVWNGRAFEVSTAMTTNRLPLPSAETAAMLPCKSGGISGPTAAFAQFAGSKVSPAGSLRADSSWGSIALSEISVTLYSGPKLDFTSATLLMSAFAEEASEPDEQPASTHTDAAASNTFNIVANLPKADVQLRNVDTVLTSRSAANCGGSAGSAEPGSAVSAVNA